jgi:glycerol uptake facilitator-like aquaporin
MTSATQARGIAMLMGFEAATLAVIASLHLSGVLAGGKKPFRPTAAGIAEAVICTVLVYGAVALSRKRDQARTVAAAAVGFAILGFILGLAFTLRGGDSTDVAYHATMLPLLLLTLLALRRPTGERQILAGKV